VNVDSAGVAVESQLEGINGVRGENSSESLSHAMWAPAVCT